MLKRSKLSPPDWLPLSECDLRMLTKVGKCFPACALVSPRVTGLYRYLGKFFIIFTKTTFWGPYVIRLLAIHIGVYEISFDFGFLEFLVCDRSPVSSKFDEAVQPVLLLCGRMCVCPCVPTAVEQSSLHKGWTDTDKGWTDTDKNYNKKLCEQFFSFAGKKY